MSKHEQFQAMDELDMATTRLRLRLPDEDTPDTTQLNIIEPSEVWPRPEYSWCLFCYKGMDVYDLARALCVYR